MILDLMFLTIPVTITILLVGAIALFVPASRSILNKLFWGNE